MKTLNDSNNNFNSTKSHATQQSSFLSNGSLRTDSDIHVHPSLSTQNHFQRSKLSRTTNQNGIKYSQILKLIQFFIDE